MSSSNLVGVTYAPEAVYGVKDTPISGVTLQTARFTSESLSGTPTTVESAAIRTDRMSGGLVSVGLDVGGALDFELASDTFFDDFFEGAMMSAWVAAQTIAATDVTLTPDPADDQKANLVITGDFSTIGAAVGDVIQLLPVSGSPVTVTVITVTSTTELVVATKRGELAIAGDTMDVVKSAYLDIGTSSEGRSFLIAKAYKDVLHDAGTDEHSQTYLGSLVSSFNITAEYGAIVTGNFGTLGNGYIQEVGPSYEQQVVAGGGTVNPAGTSNPLNASIDVPVVTTDGESTNFCIESFSIDFSNGLDPSNCIGKIEPIGYTLGTAAIGISTSIYLSDTSYNAFMQKKLSQVPLSMTFTMLNSDGGYAISLAAVQLSFPDPASGGQNQQTMIEAAGAAKVGANGESAIRVWKLEGDQ